MTEEMLSTEDLRQRWNKKSRKAVQRLIRKYSHILRPMKIGRDLMFYSDNVKKFEEQCRIVRE